MIIMGGSSKIKSRTLSVDLTTIFHVHEEVRVLPSMHIVGGAIVLVKAIGSTQNLVEYMYNNICVPSFFQLPAVFEIFVVRPPRSCQDW